MTNDEVIEAAERIAQLTRERDEARALVRMAYAEPLRWAKHGEESSARLKYGAFIAANEWLMPELEQRSLELLANGRTHYGIAALIEGIRYEYARTNDPNSHFKICNNYRAYMARDIMKKNPSLTGFFSLRDSRADSDDGDC